MATVGRIISSNFFTVRMYSKIEK
ncbi:uncharacterized protein METZ01_LOCUS143128, partial [marine metagenome]